MEKLIKLRVSIENEFYTGFRGNFEVTDTIFTSYERWINVEEVSASVKKAISKLSGFSMLTIDVEIRDSNDYRSTDKIEFSYRFIQKYNEVTGNYMDRAHNRFRDFIPTDKKEIYLKIREAADMANRRFIEEVKACKVTPV